MTIGVLVVDDQPLFCAGIGRLLDAEADLVYLGAAHTGSRAVVAAERSQPDVVLMDLRMPDGDGISATRALAHLDRPPRVLVLTTFRDRDAVERALRSGATGFITKDATPEALLRAVREVARGRPVVDEVARTWMLHDPPRRPAPDLGAIAPLTPREREVYLHAARGLTNAQIARFEHVSENTVCSHVSAILRKLALTSRNQLPHHAQRYGLLTPGPHEVGPSRGGT